MSLQVYGATVVIEWRIPMTKFRAAIPGRPNELSVDGRVLAFGLLISLATGLLSRLFPALQASRPDLNETLKEGARSGGGASGRRASALLH
jgi:hypothetical protein